MIDDSLIRFARHAMMSRSDARIELPAKDFLELVEELNRLRCAFAESESHAVTPPSSADEVPLG